VGARLTMPDTVATFEQFPYILNAGIKGVAGVEDGTGSGYVYTYALPTTASSTLYCYTIECGDNQEEEEAAYCFVESFKLSGKPKEGVMMGAEWVGRQVATGAFTALTASSIPTVEELVFGNSTLYIDTTGGSFGGTTKTSTLLGYDLKVTECAKAVFSGDGALYFTFEQALFPKIELDLTCEYDATGVAIIEDFRAETARLVRLKIEGSALTTTSTYTKKTVIIDLAGKFTNPTFDEIDGDDVATATLVSRYNETAADWGKFIVVNQLTALP